MAVQYPLSQPLLVVLQGQIPVGSLFLDGLRAAQLALRVDKLLRAEGAAALLALVAVGIGVAALGASFFSVQCPSSYRDCIKDENQPALCHDLRLFLVYEFHTRI